MRCPELCLFCALDIFLDVEQNTSKANKNVILKMQRCSSDASLDDRICDQVEFYFSERNLRKDKFLQKAMDDEGWVKLDLIHSFNKMRSLTPDISVVQRACRGSAVVELTDDLASLRRRGGTTNSAGPSVSVADRMKGITATIQKFVTEKPTWMTIKLLLRRLVSACLDEALSSLPLFAVTGM